MASVAALLTVMGCQGPQDIKTTDSLCAGKITIGEAAAVLSQQRQQLGPIRATARSEIQFPDGSREGINGQVWFIPPDRMLFTGDKFGEIRFGANENEFWLRVKPKMDTYWYGSRVQAQACSHVLPMNPASLAEALGMVEVDATWELFHRDGYDWLTLRERGRPVKRVYVDACDYRVVRIEYFDFHGQITAATDLSSYAATGNGLMLPMTIRLTTYYRGQEDSTAEFELRQVRRFEPTERQMHNLFERPGRDGYGTVLRLDGHCNFVEEN